MYARSSIFSSEVLDYEADGTFMQGAENELQQLFDEMEDPETDFVRNMDSCKYCDFKAICGQTEEE